MFYCQSVELHCFAPSSFVSPYSDSSIAVLEGAVLIGMISCIIRSVSALVNASGAETAVNRRLVL